MNENELDSVKKDRESEQNKMRDKINELDRQKIEIGFKL